MSLVTGQTLRRLGLLIEAVSLLGILSVRRGNVDRWVRNGLDPNIVLTTTFVVGLGMWGVGWVLVRRERLRERKGDRPAGWL